MRSLKLLIQQNPVACLAETVSHFDIFDASWKVQLVKSTNLLEHGAADGTACTPERGCHRIPILMHVMVEQVPILAHDARCPGPIVVRSEHRGERGIGVEYLDDP